VGCRENTLVSRIKRGIEVKGGGDGYDYGPKVLVDNGSGD
jgi:hypothetical protein